MACHILNNPNHWVILLEPLGRGTKCAMSSRSGHLKSQKSLIQKTLSLYTREKEESASGLQTQSQCTPQSQIFTSKFLVDRKQVRRLAQKTLSALPNFYQFIYFYYISYVAHVFPKDSPQFPPSLGIIKLLLSQWTQTWVISLAICKWAFDLFFNVINLPIKGLWFFGTGIIKRSVMTENQMRTCTYFTFIFVPPNCLNDFCIQVETKHLVVSVTKRKLSFHSFTWMHFRMIHLTTSKNLEKNTTEGFSSFPQSIFRQSLDVRPSDWLWITFVWV